MYSMYYIAMTFVEESYSFFLPESLVPSVLTVAFNVCVCVGGWVRACIRNLFCSGDSKFKQWRLRFLTLTQITQFKSVLCYYRPKDTQPHEFVDLEGYTVDYGELYPLPCVSWASYILSGLCCCCN